jgi:hypothetical protein
MGWGVPVSKPHTKPPAAPPGVLLYIHTNKGKRNAPTSNNELR